MPGRIDGSRLKVWLLLAASRRFVVAALLGGLFVAFVALGTLDPVGLRTAMARADPIVTLFQALLTAVITGVTLVVTINQLVISQELGAVGDQRDRMEGSMAFRRDVEDVLGESVAPAEPAAFLRALVESTGARADALAEAISDGLDAERRDRVQSYVDSLTAHASTVADQLKGARFGRFEVVFAALD